MLSKLERITFLDIGDLGRSGAMISSPAPSTTEKQNTFIPAPGTGWFVAAHGTPTQTVFRIPAKNFGEYRNRIMAAA